MADLFLADTRVFTLTGAENALTASVHRKLLCAGTRPFMFRVLGTVTSGAAGLRGLKGLQFTGAGHLVSSETGAPLGALLTSRYCLQGVVKFTSLASTQCLFSLCHANGSWNAVLSFDLTTGKFKWSTFYGTTTVAINGTTTLLANTEYHVCVERDGSGVTRLFVNGITEGSATLGSIPANDNYYYVSIGGQFTGTANRLTATLDDFTLDWDMRYGADFTPPAALPETTLAFDQGRLTDGLQTRLAYNLSYVPGTPKLVTVKTHRMTPNEGGNYRITGTVSEKSAPTNRPLARKVVLHRTLDGKRVAETWSNAVDGTYTFSYISGLYTYYVIAFDHEGNYRGVIADNLTPEAMQ